MNASGGKSRARQRVGADTTHDAADGSGRGAGGLAPCVALEDIVAAASEITGVSSRAISGSGSCADLTRTRHVIWYVAMEHYRFSGAGVRRLFFKDLATIYRGRDRITREMLANNRTRVLVRAVRFRAEDIAAARIAAATVGECGGAQTSDGAA